MQFRDLHRQYEAMRAEMDEALLGAARSGAYIMGPQVAELEQQLAAYVGVKHCISCANGTDALRLALMALGIGSGDAVFVPDFTFFATAEAVAMVGATPIFVDVDKDTFNIDDNDLCIKIRDNQNKGLAPRAVIAVDLFGRPADYDSLQEVCEKYGLLLVEDGAQGFGGFLYDDRKNCSFGDISTTSFFPAKPLGCYGDGGAIFTDDDQIATLCRSIAVHGKDMGHPDDPNAKYNNARLGMNSRLDTLQAGILLAKLKAFKDFELDAVNKVAKQYTDKLSRNNALKTPVIMNNCHSSWAQYTIQLPEGAERTKIQSELKAAGIPTNIYYIKPMHLQGAFKNTRSSIADCPVTERLCKTVLCLPIHPYLTEEEVDMVCEKLSKCFE